VCSEDTAHQLQALCAAEDAASVVAGMDGIIRDCMPAGGSVRTAPVDPPATTFWCPELDASRARFRGARRMYRSRAETRAARNEHYGLLRYKKRCHTKTQ
jgi:hypothetical protein